MDLEKILVIDDDPATRTNLARLLQREGRTVVTAGSGSEGIARLADGPYDLVLTDLVMEGATGLEVLARSKELDPGAEVIIVTGHASIPTAITAMSRGAFYYLEKPLRADQVRSLAERAIEKSRLFRRVNELEARLEGGPGEPTIIAQSREMAETVKLLRQVAETDCNVLITGESGSGKELAARLLHYHSRRRSGRFMAINCGAFSEELLANELFGHEKEAYTGAGSARAGLLETASGGSLLLDEVGDMPLSMQVKMLRTIQEQELIRVGGTQPVQIDVRIIAATHQDLKKAVTAGLFRQDLFFRLNVISIRVPALRERKDDVPLLASYFLKRTCERWDRTLSGFSEDAAKRLLEYSYPGNVRELENIVERAVAVCRGEMVQAHDLPSDLSEMEVFSFDQSDHKVRTLEELKHDYIQWVLNKTGRNKTRAAEVLGIDRASLWRHLKRHEIED